MDNGGAPLPIRKHTSNIGSLRKTKTILILTRPFEVTAAADWSKIRSLIELFLINGENICTTPKITGSRTVLFFSALVKI